MPEKTQQQASDMEGELASNRELTAAMVAAMPDGVILFDMDGKIIAVNPAIEKISGYTSDELVQRNAADVVAKSVKPEDQKKIMGARKMALEGKVPGPVSVTMITKGGQEIPVSFGFALIKDAQGKPTYILATHKDMTEFRRDEKIRDEYIRDLNFLSKVTMEIVELPLEKDIYKFAAEKLQLLVGDSIIAVSFYDKATNSLHTRALLGIGKYTDSVVKLIGASPFAMSFKVTYSEAMSEMTTSKLNKIPDGLYGATFGQVPKAVCQTIEKFFNVGDVYGIGLRREKQLFGAVVIYTRCGTELRQGIIETFVNQVSVILERNQTNEKRVEAMNLASNIVDGMTDVVGISDMEGRITKINEAVEDWGYKKEELIGKPVVDVLAKRSLPKLEEERKRSFETGVVRNLELIGFKKDESEFPVLVNVSLMKDAEEKPTGRIFSLKDITEIKRAAEKEKELVAVAAEAVAEKKRAAELDKAYRELREKSDLLQQERVMLNSIIDLNPYGIQIFDAEGHHVRANQVFINMFQSVPPADYCFFDDPIAAKAGFHEAHLAVKEGKTHVDPEVWYNAHWLYPELPDKLSCFRSTVFPIMNAAGKMESFVVMFEDITERKRAEERLERFNRVAVGQELEMVRLEEEVNTLLKKSGLPRKYETPEKIKTHHG